MISKYKLYIHIVGLILAIVVLIILITQLATAIDESLETKSKVDTVTIVKHDTVFVNRTDKELSELPSYTKFKVSDFVCVTHTEVTGVVQSIRWSTNPGANNVLVYAVRLYRNIYDEDDDLEYDFDEFYENELTAGKCN
jgi:hypothetical protein